MNCLFVNLHEPVAHSGGIETVTGLLCEEFLSRYSIKSYCIWHLPGGKNAIRYPFAESIGFSKPSVSEISGFLDKWSIDIVIVQAYNEMVPVMRDAINKLNRKIPLLYVLHSMPGWELKFYKWKYIKKLPAKQGFRGWVKAIGYPLFKYASIRKIRRMYKRNSILCDHFILLSDNFKDNYVNDLKIKDESKLYSIPNPVSFRNYKSADIQVKKNTVLIVSRFFEFQKRILLALKIWKEIENAPEFSDWTLKIIGSGEGEIEYKNYIKENSLKRVSLIGQQDPTPYYKEASIFLMTSLFEGFGLTLVEAQGYGCIPIVFNSFGSLREIVHDKKDGIIVKEGEITEYVFQLKKLMMDRQFRDKLRINAINNVSNFSLQKVGGYWFDFFSYLGIIK